MSTPSLSQAAAKPTNFRWVICGLLFYATTLAYIDRSILNAMAPDLEKIIGWRPYQYGLINAAFSLAYAIGFIIMGNLIDKIGTRLGYAIALATWTLAALGTVFTGTPFQFGVARFFLGLGEAGNFPAAIKTTAEWFSQKQRATATGIFNSGSNLGAILAPIIALTLVPLFGWRAAFLVTPILATVWIILWLTIYRTPTHHPRVNDAERAIINADSATAMSDVRVPPVKWRHILPHRQTWAFMAGKFFTDPIWWFYLFWAGTFFADTFHVKLKGVAGPLIYIYILADGGSIAGGWLSSNLIKRGFTPNFARKITMALCALCILPVIAAPYVPINNTGLWIAATLIGVAAAAHQGFSANIFTTTSDMFPKRAVSSVTGLGGLAGALGSIIMQSVSGVIREVTGSYVVMFIIAGSVYSLAIVIFHLLAPRFERVDDLQLETRPMPRVVTAFIFAVLGFVIGTPLSYLLQNHSLSLAAPLASTVPATTLTMPPSLPVPPGPFSFPEYIASVFSGDIFKSLDHARLLPPLLWTPIIAILASAILGTLLHSIIFKSKAVPTMP